MEIRQLRHFAAIAEHGSLGRAASAIAISEPALSKSLSKLEAELGAKLFERGSKGISLTVYGQSLLTRAEAILGEVSTIRREVDELRDGHHGIVRVGMRPSFGTTYLPHAVARIMKSRRNFKAVLCEGFVPTLISELVQGKLDFIVATELEGLHPSLVQEYFTDSPVRLLARADNPLANGKRIPATKIRHYDWIMPLATDPIRQHMHNLLAQNGVEPISVIMETNSVPAMKNFVREMDCLTFFPVHLYSPSQDGDLAFVNVPELVWHRRLDIVRRRLSPLSPAAQVLVDEIKSLEIVLA